MKRHVVMDNLDCHQTPRSKRCAGTHADTLLVFTPANCTDVVSVTDQLTALWKKDLEFYYEQWVDENFDRWDNEPHKITAGERRILFSNWVEKAWDRMCARQQLINDMFVKCGYLMYKDGSNKDKMRVTGLDDYKIDF